MNYAVTLFVVFLAMSTMAQKKQADLIRQLEEKRITLPNGSKITPAGNTLQLGDLPLNLAISRSGKFMAIANCGQKFPSIELFDLKTDKIISDVSFPNGWYGVDFNYNDKFLFASAGKDNRILKYSVTSKGLVIVDSFMLGDKVSGNVFPTGIEVDEKSNRMYVVTKGDNSLYVIDLNKKLILKKFDLGGEGYTCMLDKFSSTLFVSVWGSNKVLLINTISIEAMKTIPVGGHPNEMTQSSKGKFLYVANSIDNTVSVIDLTQLKVVEILDGGLFRDDLPGTTANGLALNNDESRLYFANSDKNCLAVFDISNPGAGRAMGFIPVGWQPGALKIVKRKIYVLNGKGYGSENGYGALSIISEPGPEDLGVYTTIAYRNSPGKKDTE